MIEVETLPTAAERNRGEADSTGQVYSTTLLDFNGGRAIEWAYVPAALLEWEEPDLGRTLEATGLKLLTEVPSFSALPAAVVAMLEFAHSPDDATRMLDELLNASLGTWSDAVDSAALAFAQFVAFSAVLPVEWSPLEKVPVPDAVVGASVAGIGGGAVAAHSVALAAGAHGVVLLLAGAGGVVVGAVAAPLVAIPGAYVAWRLLRHRFRVTGAASSET